MKMIDEKFEDINGRKHRLYKVRSTGAQGFGILDKYHNFFISHPLATREEAWDYLREADAEPVQTAAGAST